MGLLGNLSIIDNRLVLKDFLKDARIDAVRNQLQILKNRKILDHRRKFLCLFGGYIAALRSRIGNHLVLFIKPLHQLQCLVRLELVFTPCLCLQCCQIEELRRM